MPREARRIAFSWLCLSESQELLHPLAVGSNAWLPIGITARSSTRLHLFSFGLRQQSACSTWGYLCCKPGYLTWTFKENYRGPKEWLESTHEQRLKDFSPAQLRRTSKGRFLSKDYQDHCELGGHPVPRGRNATWRQEYTCCAVAPCRFDSEQLTNLGSDCSMARSVSKGFSGFGSLWFSNQLALGRLG